MQNKFLRTLAVCGTVMTMSSVISTHPADAGLEYDLLVRSLRANQDVEDHEHYLYHIDYESKTPEWLHKVKNGRRESIPDYMIQRVWGAQGEGIRENEEEHEVLTKKAAAAAKSLAEYRQVKEKYPRPNSPALSRFDLEKAEREK